MAAKLKKVVRDPYPLKAQQFFPKRANLLFDLSARRDIARFRAMPDLSFSFHRLVNPHWIVQRRRDGSAAAEFPAVRDWRSGFFILAPTAVFNDLSRLCVLHIECNLRGEFRRKHVNETAVQRLLELRAHALQKIQRRLVLADGWKCTVTLRLF